jgi:NitT/TauT family transport system substrate-binding protein
VSHKIAPFILLILVLSVAMVPGLQAQDDLTDQTFLLTFVPNIQFAPLYTAVEMGYFADEGVNLTSIEHLDEPDIANLIADNQYQFGMVSGEQVIMARSQGRKITFVYEWFQKYPVGIVTPVDTGINSVTDLKGRTVGIPGRFGASFSGLVALLSANDMTEDDIRLETIGYTAPEAICVGFETGYAQGVEASVVYIGNEPFQIQQRCTDVKVFPVSDAVDMVSNGIVTNEETIANNPDLVRAVVKAFDRGLRETINNPAEAYLLSSVYIDSLPFEDDLKVALEDAAAAQSEFLATNPDSAAIAASREALWDDLTGQFETDRLVQFRVLLNSIELWDADYLGYTDSTSWELTQDILRKMEFLAEPLADLDTIYTNDFLPEEGS